MPHRWLLALALACCILVVPRGALARPAPASCTFTLGFQTLHDLISEIVGDCTADAAYGTSGDALQPTTHGLLVWRKADNWTAFTDGATTWINGPHGLQSRPNDRRFLWEGGGAYHGDPCSLLLTPADMGAGWTISTPERWGRELSFCAATLSTTVENEAGLYDAAMDASTWDDAASAAGVWGLYGQGPSSIAIPAPVVGDESKAWASYNGRLPPTKYIDFYSRYGNVVVIVRARGAQSRLTVNTPALMAAKMVDRIRAFQ